MTIWTILLRCLLLVALTVWVGGFTFYSAVVIPVLHDQLKSPLEAGLITQRVTHALNGIGGASLLLGWCFIAAARRGAIAKGRADLLRYVPVGTSTACLAVLLVVHWMLDRKLETGWLAGFYPWHRTYLWTSTVQWLANLGLLVQCAGLFTPSRGSHR
jgi:hypothetical protein